MCKRKRTHIYQIKGRTEGRKKAKEERRGEGRKRKNKINKRK